MSRPYPVTTKEEKNVAQGAMDSQEDSDQSNRPRKKRRIERAEKSGERVSLASQSKGFRKSLESSDSPSNISGPANLAQPHLSYETPQKGKVASIRDDFSQTHDDQSSASTPPSETTLRRTEMGPGESQLSSTRDIQKNSSELAAPPSTVPTSDPSQKSIKETLNPRMIPNPPASHTTRFKLLSLLHQYITKLNDQAKLSNDSSSPSIIMSSQQVIVMCLDLEEHAARHNPTVYENVFKQSIMKYKRMTPEEWQMERYTRNPRPNAIPIVNPTPPPRIDTGLSPKDELAFLHRLRADQTSLSAFGYVTSPPTQEETDAAVRGVEAAHNWEVCERCETRFQVFPGRRAEDGLPTTGGKCKFHDGKRCRLGHGQFGWSCCKNEQGTKGCRTLKTHVFKVSDSKRMAAIMPFVATPENRGRLVEEAVSFDCEMGYTTYGLELIRLTAVSWPSGRPLVDVLVRPLGEILDFNSRFSGVWPQAYTDAIEASRLPPANMLEGAAQAPLPIVNSPAEARALLFKYISPTTTLIGHALENDLKAVRIIHPRIVDTALVFPHSQGLPKRNSLRMLSSMRLDRQIQCGFGGHDSHDDARAAGDLVRWKIKDEVKKWKTAGWKVEDGKFPPVE